MEELLTLPGVGRKTANLVLILAHGSRREHLRRHARPPHLEPPGVGARPARRKRPSRRSTRRPTRRWWPIINLYLVTWGQNVCRPVYPLCPQCVLADICPKVGVTKVGKRAFVLKAVGAGGADVEAGAEDRTMLNSLL